MDVKQPQPDGPAPEPTFPPLAVRLLWPEAAPDDAGAVDHETAVMAERRAKTFRVFARGRSMREVAAEVGSSLSTVCRDVHHVLDGYRLVALQDAAALVGRQLAKLGEMQAAAWEGWLRSIGEQVERQAARRGRGEEVAKEARVRRRQRDGDPRFLMLLERYWRCECLLMGLLSRDDLKNKTTLPPTKLVAGIDPAEVV